MTTDEPTVSIIIAVYNEVKTIKKCLDSCLEQDFANNKIIVIDGGSTDGTEKVLSAYSDQIAYWISEPDEGIYNAWNKALHIVSTDWVVFLGADDEWTEPTSLSQMMDLALYPSINFVCAQIYKRPYSRRKGRLFGDPWDYSRMKWGMNVAHAGMLHHISLFEKYGYFDETYHIAGDYEFLLRTGKNIRAEYLPETIVFMGGGGVSNTNLSVVHKEGRRALVESPDFGSFYGWFFFLRFYLRHFRRLNERS